MKSSSIIAISAAAILGGAHAVAPERKRVDESVHQSQGSSAVAVGPQAPEAYDPYLGYQGKRELQMSMKETGVPTYSPTKYESFTPTKPWPTYAPTAMPAGVQSGVNAAAIDRKAGAATLLVLGAAGVWASLN